MKIRVLLSSGNCCAGLGPRTIIPVSRLGWWWQQRLKKTPEQSVCPAQFPSTHEWHQVGQWLAFIWLFIYWISVTSLVLLFCQGKCRPLINICCTVSGYSGTCLFHTMMIRFLYLSLSTRLPKSLTELFQLVILYMVLYWHIMQVINTMVIFSESFLVQLVIPSHINLLHIIPF